MMEFFEYEDGVCKININEYDYPKSEFNLNDKSELGEFIKTINVLYDLCDDDRLQNEVNANDEFYMKEEIVSLIQEELNKQERQLNLINHYPVELTRIIAKIEVLEELLDEIDEVLC